MITLLGDPLSTNHVYKVTCKFRTPKVYMSEEGRDLKESYQWQAKSQWRGGLLEGDLRIKIRLFFANKRKHDYDNYGKLLNDSLSGIVFVDDSQIKEATIIMGYDKENPRAELEINKI